MTTATHANARADQGIKGALWEGNIMFRVKNSSGVYGPWVGPINGTALSFNPGEGETVQRISKMIGSSGQALDSVITPGTPTIAFGFNDMGIEQFKLATRGESAAISEAGGTATAEDQTLPTNIKPGWVKLPDRNINSAASFVATDNGAATTYTFAADGSADYGPIDYREGWVYIPANSTIVGAQVVEWTYTHFAVTGTQINGNKVDQLIMELVFNGKNKATLQWDKFTAHEASVQPTQDIDLLGADFAAGAYSGTLTTPTGKNQPYEIEWDLQHATS